MTTKIFLTVDTELWPNLSDWPLVPLRPDDDCKWEIQTYLNGETREASYGIPFQLRVLREHGLKATYFIDAMFSMALGIAPLRELISQVQQNEQEVGLHLHPEWLTDPRCKNLPQFCGPLITDYTQNDQNHLIKVGLNRLHEAGANQVSVFRAGSWGANQITLNALANVGLLMDSSLNASYQESLPEIPDRQTLQIPTVYNGVTEFPVTQFLDGSIRGSRPLHVAACSFDEFRFVFEAALEQERAMLVVVFHSFEFVRVKRIPRGRLTSPQRLIIRRFEQICDYLKTHSDKFETCHFGDTRISIPDMRNNVTPIRSSRTRTAWRNAQQLVSHFY